MIVTIFLKNSSRFIFALCTIIIFVYPILLIFFDYELGWNFDLLVYENFWSVDGFIRNLLFNGYHPVMPWVAFMLFGVWLGRQPIDEKQFMKKSAIVSVCVLLATISVSWLLQKTNSNQEIYILLGTSPIPPVPLYMITGCSVAVMAIMASIWIGQQFTFQKAVVILAKTGRMALTFYIAHVVIGILPFYFLFPNRLGGYSIIFSLAYSAIFCSGCILFSIIWSKSFQTGPIEWLMRKTVGYLY